MSRVQLEKLLICNFGPIVQDEVSFESLTYFVGRNNSGKSHYINAIDLLLTPKRPTSEELIKHQKDPSQPIRIEATFSGVGGFLSLVPSTHQGTISKEIIDGKLKIGRVFNPQEEEDEDKDKFGIVLANRSIHNPRGFKNNLLKILPETILIDATADTVDEVKNKSTTALGKLKKEVLTSFFSSLHTKTEEALETIEEFLNSSNPGQRSTELGEFEGRLKEELSGEFSNVEPRVKFELPDEAVIADQMKIFLNDGHDSEVEQKGHGLQRAVLLALLRMLAKHGARYQTRPAPIFLIGELETFLHPYAQIQLAEALVKLTDRYQVITTTHSPFVITPSNINGYRRVSKSNTVGAKSIPFVPGSIDIGEIMNHLQRRGNLEGLFADRIIVLEGSHDEGFIGKLLNLFQLTLDPSTYFALVSAYGKTEIRQVKKFYEGLTFSPTRVLADLDFLFSNDFEKLLDELQLDNTYAAEFKTHIGWSTTKEPSLKDVLLAISNSGYPARYDDCTNELEQKGIYILKRGAPEYYYKNDIGLKGGWKRVSSINDLEDVDELKRILTELYR